MKATKFIPIFTAIIGVGLLSVDSVRAGGTGICVTPDGRNVPCSQGSSGGGGSGRGSGSGAEIGIQFMNEVINAYQRAKQRQKAASIAASNKGVEYHNMRDYDTAMAYYNEALKIDPKNSTARDNLRIAKSRKAFEIGEKYDQNKDYETAIRYYEEALKYDPGIEWIQERLRSARRSIRWSEYERELPESRAKLSQGLGELAAGIGSSPSSTGGLQFMDPGKLLDVDPGKQKAGQQVRIKEVPLPAALADLRKPLKLKQAELSIKYREKSLQQDKLVEKIEQLEKKNEPVNPRFLQALEKLELERKVIDLEWVATEKVIRELTLDMARRYESPAPPIDLIHSPRHQETARRISKEMKKLIEESNKNRPWGPGKKYRTVLDYMRRPGAPRPKSVGSTGTTATEVTIGGGRG